MVVMTIRPALVCLLSTRTPQDLGYLATPLIYYFLQGYSQQTGMEQVLSLRQHMISYRCRKNLAVAIYSRNVPYFWSGSSCMCGEMIKLCPSFLEPKRISDCDLRLRFVLVLRALLICLCTPHM